MFLCACSWLKPTSFPLVPANSRYLHLVAQQQWHIHYEQQDYRLNAVMQINGEVTTLIFLDAMGQRLVTMEQSSSGMSIQQTRAHPLRPLWSDLLAAAQFIYWPMNDLVSHAPPEWTFEGDQRVRYQYFSGILAALAEYQSGTPWQGTVLYDNKKNDFQLRIKSSPLESVLR